MGQVEIKEFGHIVLHGVKGATIRVIMNIEDREFVRLSLFGYKEVWREEGVTGFCEGNQHQELESIFRAWCLENKQDINNPKQINYAG